MQTAQLVVLGILGLLAIAAVWIVFRAATAHGLLWGIKGLALMGVAVALVFGGIAVWVRLQQRLPAGATVENVEASHGALLARLRAAVRERDLAGVQNLEAQFSGPELRELLERPEILQASVILPDRRVLRVHDRAGRGQQPRGHWHAEPSGPHEAFVTRGWLQYQGARLDTLEYLEAVTDASGASVMIQLTLRLDGFLSGGSS